MTRKRQFTMLAEIEHKFTFPGLEPGEHEVAYPKVEITFDFLPGRPAYTPRGEYAPIDPPDPPEVEFVSATLVDPDGLSLDASNIEQFARDWISDDEGWRQAVDFAEAA